MTIRSLSLGILLVATAVACSPRTRGLSNAPKATQVKSVLPTDKPHNAEECPALDGTYVNSGVELSFKTTKGIPNGLIYDVSYVVNGKTESETWAADGQLVEFGKDQAYIAVCSKNVVTKYSAKDKKKTGEVSLSLNEKDELVEVLDGKDKEPMIWTRKQTKK